MSDEFLSGLAPAKINLFLHVTGRRADGYHLLQTAFRMLDHGDKVSVRLRSDGLINRLSDLPGVPAETDLVVRAARLLQEKTGCRFGTDIRVDKSLPMGGGLGGGSSDAATVLLLLNRLWQLDVPRHQLQDWGLTLGADVPFFLFGRSAWAEGVGEVLQPLALEPAWYVVVEPPVSVPTAEIFSSEALTRNSPLLIMQGFSGRQANVLIDTEARNDLQPVACALYPQITLALEGLARFGLPRMSGSGACVFLRCAAKAEAEAVVAALSDRWKVWCAAALDEHPLYGCCDE